MVALPRSNDPSSRSPAQRALYRLLETVIPDRAVVEAAIGKALSDAGIPRLPDDFAALTVFVRETLAPHLGDANRPWLISAVLDDLEAEAELARGSDEGSDEGAGSPPVNTGTMPPPNRGAAALPPTVRREPSSAPVARSSARMQLTPRTAARIARRRIVVFDGDRFERATLARALVQFRYDVTVLDDGKEAFAAIAGPDAIDVLILDVDGPNAAALLGAVVRAQPRVALLAWTSAPNAVVEHLARIAGVRAFALVGRRARNTELHEALLRLLP